MNYNTNNNWHYTTVKGYYFRKGDVISDEIYLGKSDSIDNWTVITEEEKTAFEEEQRMKTEEERDKPAEL